MFSGSAASVNRALRRFFGIVGSAHGATQFPGATSDMVQIINALHQREAAAQETTLRQLHRVADLAQPDALRAARALEMAGIVRIEADQTDAFASAIRLSEPARRRFGRSTPPSDGPEAR